MIRSSDQSTLCKALMLHKDHSLVAILELVRKFQQPKFEELEQHVADLEKELESQADSGRTDVHDETGGVDIHDE